MDWWNWRCAKHHWHSRWCPYGDMRVYSWTSTWNETSCKRLSKLHRAHEGKLENFNLYLTTLCLIVTSLEGFFVVFRATHSYIVNVWPRETNLDTFFFLIHICSSMIHKFMSILASRRVFNEKMKWKRQQLPSLWACGSKLERKKNRLNLELKFNRRCMRIELRNSRKALLKLDTSVYEFVFCVVCKLEMFIAAAEAD